MSSILSWTLVLFVMSHAADARLPQAAVPPGDVLLTVKDVVGCYELTSIKWPRQIPAAARATVTPPRFSFFSSEPSHDSGYYRIRLRGSRSVHQLTSWRLLGPTELNAIWSTGYDGVAVVVRRRSTDQRFYGRAYIFTDVGRPASALERPASPHDGTVILKRVACWPGAG
jgi:hypothetical protein